MLSLIVSEQKPTVELVETDGSLSLNSMQKVVGGYITPAFTIPSPDGSGRLVTGYVNDEGLLMNLRIGIYLRHGSKDEVDFVPLAGSMVFSALTGDGETAELSETEKDYIRKMITFYDFLGLPSVSAEITIPD